MQRQLIVFAIDMHSWNRKETEMEQGVELMSGVSRCLAVGGRRQLAEG